MQCAIRVPIAIGIEQSSPPDEVRMLDMTFFVEHVKVFLVCIVLITDEAVRSNYSAIVLYLHFLIEALKSFTL